MVQPARAAAIPGKDYWMAIDGMPAAEAISYARAYIRAHYGQIGLAEAIEWSLRQEQGCSQRGTHNHAVPDRDFFMERRSR